MPNAKPAKRKPSTVVGVGSTRIPACRCTPHSCAQGTRAGTRVETYGPSCTRMAAVTVTVGLLRSAVSCNHSLIMQQQ